VPGERPVRAGYHAVRTARSWRGIVAFTHLALFRRAGDYVDKILRGAKPAELPVERPTKFELVLNLKTAKAIGVKISPEILVRAEQVIE